MKYIKNNSRCMQSGWYVLVYWSYLTHGGSQERCKRVPAITDVRDPYFVRGVGRISCSGLVLHACCGVSRGVVCVGGHQ